MRFALLLALMLPGAAIAEEMSASWFADHPQERAAVNTICKEYASAAMHNPNCVNAFNGGVRADLLEGQRRIAQNGVANLGQPPVSYWTNPANRADRDFWAVHCKRAEARHVSADRLEAMYCPAIKAAGGY